LQFSGGDIGPFKAIEESVFTCLLSPEELSTVLAWYYTSGSCGGAVGLFVTGWLLQHLEKNRMSTLDTHRVVFWLYAAMGLWMTMLTTLLSRSCEVHGDPMVVSEDGEEDDAIRTETSWLLSRRERLPIPTLSMAAETRGFLRRFGPILVFDQFGTGLSTDSWLIYFIRARFTSCSDGIIGSIFSICSIIISVSNILAIPVTWQIGKLPTMILGHWLASTSLLILPWPDDMKTTIALLIIRAVFLDFDQASRQAFIAQSVATKDRTAALGIINMIRTLSQGVGPSVTGYLAQKGHLGLSFVLAGLSKWLYDLGLATVFGFHNEVS
jgi:hypothetical protein